jgi:transcriptional regulator with XRE-family HTH domain
MVKHQEDFLKWFGLRLRSIRQSKSLSQEDLAGLAGIDRTYVGGVERGERNLSLLNIKRLSDALGIKVSDLFHDSDEL